MTINNEIDLALIVAIIALITPLLTSIINVLYQLLIRHLDRKEQNHKDRIKPIEDIFIGYLRAVGKCISSSTTADLSDYGAYYPLILLYLPKDKQEIFLELDADMLVKNKINNIDNKYIKITNIIQEELDKLYKSK